MIYTLTNSAGYTKDKIASILFIITAITIYYLKDLNKLKTLAISILILCFLIDVTFTMNPHYYMYTLGNNIATHVLFGGLFLIFFLVAVNLKNFKF